VNNRLLAQSGYAKANNMVDTKWRNRPQADIQRNNQSSSFQPTHAKTTLDWAIVYKFLSERRHEGSLA
jgi:hypothetical protein